MPLPNKLFGHELVKSKEQEKEEQSIRAIVPEQDVVSDSDVLISGGRFGVPYEVDASRENEAQLIDRYRSMLIHQEVDDAVTDICNEAIVYNEDRQPVSIDLSSLNVDNSVKDKISKSFDEILYLMNFSSNGHELFKRWYVDGRIAYHISIDKDSPEKGIIDMRQLDPRRLKKITKINKEEDEETRTEVIKSVESIYTYDQSLMMKSGPTGSHSAVAPIMSPVVGSSVILPDDAVVYVTSGLSDSKTNRIVSHLHKSIRPLNQLKMMEDSLVIYRFSRAPERRVFYIDVGSLPRMKAEQLVRDTMNKYRKKMVYDTDSGKIQNDGRHTTMTDDFWFPRREGGRGTEVTTLPGGDNLGQIDDIVYFKEKLYRSLNVPISRLQPENGMALGRASEITRDEVKFSRFVDVLRNKFSEIFLRSLRVQLILKKIISPRDWKKIRERINFKYANDSFFSQLKELEILQERIRAANDVKEYVGVYFSHDYVQKNIFGMTDTDIAEHRAMIEKEKKDGHYNQETDSDAGGGFGGGFR